MKITFSKFTFLLHALFAIALVSGCAQKDDAATSAEPVVAGEVPEGYVAAPPVERDPSNCHGGDAAGGCANCGCEKPEGCNCAEGACNCGKEGSDCGCGKTHGSCAGSEGAGCANCAGKPEGCGCAGSHAGHGHDGHGHEGHDHAAHAGHNHGAPAEAMAGDDLMAQVLREGSFDASAVVRQPGAKIGDITRCTVSGEAFRVTADHPSVDYNGQPVFFCCAGCIRRFQRNPDQYIENQR